MAATILLPYTIGKSQIDSSEEFNIYYDSAVVIGNDVIQAIRSRVAFDSNFIRGRAVLESAQQYETSIASTIVGVALASAINSKVTDDMATASGTDVLDWIEEYAYTSICIGNGIVSENAPDGVSLAGAIACETQILFQRAFAIRPSSLGRVYDDNPTVTGSAVVAAADSVEHGLFSYNYDKDAPEALSSESAAVLSGQIGINYAITSTSDTGGKTSLGVDSTVVFYRLLEDTGIIRGSSNATADVSTIDDYWLGGVALIDGVSIPFTPVTYFTIPKANRIVIGSGEAYNSNYEVIGSGMPVLVNEPLFAVSSEIYAFEQYEPSFLQGTILTGTTFDNANVFSVLSPDSATILNPSLVQFVTNNETFATTISESRERGYAITAVSVINNERSRYGGQGVPEAVYGDGVNIVGDAAGRYSSPRGSTDDQELPPVGSGKFNRTLGGYAIGVNGTSGTLSGGTPVV